MKVSKRVEGTVTSSYVNAWSDEIEFSCVEDRILLTLDENHLRKLSQQICDRITHQDEQREKDKAHAENAEVE